MNYPKKGQTVVVHYTAYVSIQKILMIIIGFPLIIMYYLLTIHSFKMGKSLTLQEIGTSLLSLNLAQNKSSQALMKVLKE
jgi:uncharacterized membrane protein